MSKKTKFRQCPAAGREITAVECAEGRHTTYACPEQCPFNAFSVPNYDAFGAIERSADEKFFAWVMKHAANPEEFAAAMRRHLQSMPTTAYYHCLAWHGVYRVGPDGQTCLGKWESEGFPGLSADERVIIRGRMRMRPAIIEVHCIHDDRRVEVVDLLDPLRKPFVVVDRSFALQAVRFEVYSVHAAPLPHYARVLGTCGLMPNFHPIPFEAVIGEIVTHLGGPADLSAVSAWLTRHFEKFDKALEAVSLARRKAMFDAMDAQFGRAVYALKAPFDECSGRLATVPEIAHERLDESERKEGFTDGRVWFAGSGDPEQDRLGAGAAIGRILLGPTHWRLQALGAERLARLRERFERLMEDRVRFEGERRDNLAASIRMQEPKYDDTLVPPALLRDTPQISVGTTRVEIPPGSDPETFSPAEIIHQKEQDILDQPLPALNNQTPRQAAADPALRPQLILWLKFWISQTDRRNLETGRNDDTNWMVQELGLTELLFDPPPPRPRPAGIAPDDLDEEADSEWPPFLDLPDPPPPPDRRWTGAEASDLLQRSLDSFPHSEHPADYFRDLEYPLFSDLHAMLGEQLNDEAAALLFQGAAYVVLCYAPRGTRPPDFEPDDLARQLNRHMKELIDLGGQNFDAKFIQWVDSSSQPGILAVAISITLDPENSHANDGVALLIIATLAAVVDTLDNATRGI